MRVLVTGGAGYIGAHLSRNLHTNGHFVRIYDNLTSGDEQEKKLVCSEFWKNDIGDNTALEEACQNIDIVYHLAAYKSVEESVYEPKKFVTTNIFGTLNVLEAAEKNSCKSVICASSSAIYGNSIRKKVFSEEDYKNPVSPYGSTKWISEQMAQLMAFRSQMSIINLRYFNVAGSSHKEFIDKSPFNILPKLFKCVSNEEDFEIRGSDYETRDGTCIRDYIHIEDVVEATTRAGILSLESRCAFALNVGSGIGTSVKELVDQAQLITGKKIRTKYTDRRPGDPDIVIADNRKIKKVLNWSPKMSLRDMVASSLVSNF